ncbi:MAG: hypothetical protein ABH873_10210 [Candidatus Firestonebacteria bacterium]
MFNKIFLVVCVFISTVYGETLLERVQNEFDEKEAQNLIKEVKTNLTDKDKDLYLGIIYHNLAIKSPEKYVKEAIQYLEKECKETKNVLARGYYGSAITIEGGLCEKKKDILTASTKVEEGLTLIDDAIKVESTNVNLRFLRLNNAIAVSLSSPFKRYNIAREDLKFLKEKYDSFSSEIKAFYHFCFAQVSFGEDKVEESIFHFEKAVSVSPNSIYAKKAKEYLKQLEE